MRTPREGLPPPRSEDAPREVVLGEASEDLQEAQGMMAVSTPAVNEAACDYVRAGWVLVPFDRSTKGPQHKGWNLRERCISTEDAALKCRGNVGLAHAYSRTAVIDFDDVARARDWFAAKGVTLSELWDAPDAVRISSGRENRGKLLYKLPEGLAPLASRKIIGADKSVLFELRCATSNGLTVQDVLPPSIHPVTGRPYVWEYADPMLADWKAPPVLPPAIVQLWQTLSPEPSEPVEQKEPLGLGRRELKILLSRLDPDTDYDEWLGVGMALHHETRGGEIGLELWDTWSSRGTKYKGLEDLQRRWDGFKQGTGRLLTARWLMGLADVATVDEFDDLSEATPVTCNTAISRVTSWSPLRCIEEPPPLSFLLTGWLQTGQAGLLVAAGGTGKTSLLILLACCVATGRDFLGIPVARVGRSVILSRDDGQDDLDAVLQLVAIDSGFNTEDLELIRSRVQVISLRDLADALVVQPTASGRTYRLSKFAGELLSHLRQLEDLTLFALDTVRVFSGADSSDEQAQTLVTQLLHSVAGLPQRPTAIGMHHVGKTNARAKVEDQYAAMGSSALADHARFVLLLRRLDREDLQGLKLADGEVIDADGDALSLTATRGSLRVRKPGSLFLLRTGFTYRPLALRKPSSAEVADAAFAKAAHHLDAVGPCTKEALVEFLGGNAARARSHVQQWIGDGWLCRIAGARSPLQLTDRGAQVASIDKGAIDA